jgi:hypothetical protein
MDVACVAWRAAQARTAKPCGSDPPTLGSSFAAIRKAMVANRPGHQEERGAAVNTIAQGMSMFRLSCSDYACVLLIFAHKAAGAAKHPAFPAPSAFGGHRLRNNPDAPASRECILLSSRPSECLAARMRRQVTSAEPGPITPGLCCSEDRLPHGPIERFSSMGPLRSQGRHRVASWNSRPTSWLTARTGLGGNLMLSPDCRMPLLSRTLGQVV